MSVSHAWLQINVGLTNKLYPCHCTDHAKADLARRQNAKYRAAGIDKLVWGDATELLTELTVWMHGKGAGEHFTGLFER